MQPKRKEDLSGYKAQDCTRFKNGAENAFGSLYYNYMYMQVDYIKK